MLRLLCSVKQSMVSGEEVEIHYERMLLIQQKALISTNPIAAFILKTVPIHKIFLYMSSIYNKAVCSYFPRKFVRIQNLN